MGLNMQYKGLSYTTAVIAILGVAPWGVFLGGVAKATTELDGKLIKQAEVMLEWYIVAAQIVYMVAIAAVGFAGQLRRCDSLFNNFLAVNTFLLIYRATIRINQAQSLKDDNIYVSDWLHLPYVRALAAGQVSCAAWNLFLAIFLGLAGSTPEPTN
ncbi:hypothetical protein CHLRE_17g723800v5 [Chlamydomonas reinhardtii]|jgi:hypothetical protein|uniref:Uncharacterized protein n=1 Tax=Chlamydomonas reinhardtii TaxID=3055 RepID=A0A2K3CQH1_CHLRE|nr:uncharacterized protein CHLRE_17g723800v5 [Chlamydomonas reinhardtii]PNW70530.1 hypothetical protein CHLRE_17g723800v5 [Chlamydomonas reinhardtii]